ncbi:hypothetical protein GCM10009087_41980 [Sphingomonas oligophenolica]|uniref:Uncharacterized protein n=1 Tax=Sphingomonas oligophenolica TaxID=301154 RepID=A0ABU9YCT1_9SPHN
MTLKLPLLALALLATGAMAADSDREARDLAKALAGRTPGKPFDCVNPSWAGGPQIIGNRTLIYRETGRVLRNDLPEACPGLDEDSIIVSEIHGSQLCKGDLFYTLQRGSRIPGPHCRLGKFTPYEKPKS